MDAIVIPEIPAGILTLLSFFAPYAVALINKPWWSKTARRWVSVVVAIILALVVWVLYYAMTGDGFATWPQMILLSVVIMQASYSLVTEDSAKAVETRNHVDE